MYSNTSQVLSHTEVVSVQHSSVFVYIMESQLETLCSGSSGQLFAPDLLIFSTYSLTQLHIERSIRVVTVHVSVFSERSGILNSANHAWQYYRNSTSSSSSD